MHRFNSWAVSLIFCITFFLGKAGAQTLRIAVAANAQFVADSLSEAYQKQHPNKIDLIVSSSGKLTAQITHGAPYDIFLSADMEYAQNIYDQGKALTKPRVYAAGKLVLWAIKSLPISDLNILKSNSIKTIAIANPAIAPYGVAAISTLKKLGLYAAIKDKIVYGESISQVNQYLLSGVADVAFTAMSIVSSPKLHQVGKWIEINKTLYQPIDQGVVLLKHAKERNLKIATAFYDFLFSSEGKAIFKYFGYQVQ